MDDLYHNMSENNFDRKMKSVLENLEPEYDPATWEMLERRMDSIAFEEQPAAVDEVDKALYHTLHRLEAPYQPAHWNTLAGRLQIIAVRVRRLRIAKIAEAAIFLLLLWNTESYRETNAFPTGPTPRFSPDVPVAQVEPAPGGNTRSARANTGRNVGSALPVLVADALNHTLNLQGAASLLSENYQSASSAGDMLLQLNTLADQARTNLYAAAAPLPPHLLALSVPASEKPFGLQQMITPTKTSAKSPFYLSTGILTDMDQVHTTDGNYPGSGYGVTLAGGYRPGKWGVEAGIGYTGKQFTPKQKVDIYSGNPVDGYYGSTLSNVRADLLTVPVKVTRRLAQTGRTSAHLVAGTTLNLTLDKHYDYGSVYYPAGSVPPNLLPDPNSAPNLKSPGKGLLEKGTLADNLYASLDAGIRVEHRLGKGRHTAFVEPAYRRTFAGKGYGPKQEPVHSFSLQAGVLTYL
jgi:hypothetical protein